MLAIVYWCVISTGAMVASHPQTVAIALQIAASEWPGAPDFLRGPYLVYEGDLAWKEALRASDPRTKGVLCAAPAAA